MNKAIKDKVIARLRRIEGQTRGILNMVEEDRYCVDVLAQIQAARSALHKVEEMILRDHIDHCVVDALKSGSQTEHRVKIDELMDVIGRITK